MPHKCWIIMAACTALTTAIPTSAFAEQGLITQKALSLDMAMTIAQGALETCRAQGHKVAVTVLDAAGLTIIAFRDDGANLHRLDVSRKKAYTALIYRRPSTETVEGWAKSKNPVPMIEGTIAMGGGLPIWAGKEVIGAMSVSGAPGWDADEACGKAGIAKVADKLK